MSTRRLAIIVNGRPRSGKDSAIAALTKALQARGFATGAFSSIDPVRSLLAPISSFTEKTDAERDLLSEVGLALEKFNDYRTSRTLEFLIDFLNLPGMYGNLAAFVHMREPELIEKTRRRMSDLDRSVDFMTIRIDRDSARSVTSNSSDANVDAMEYDHIIFNNGTLGDLEKTSEMFVDDVILNQGLNA